MSPESERSSLHEMNPTGRFTDRALDYVKYRPDYPASAIDAILDGMPGPMVLSAADVGAGTGISARMLALRGVQVKAVEPNAAMSAAAPACEGVSWSQGTAEATGLPTGSVDLVLCAQAFHWFRQREAVAEFHRILRPGGRLALMWNTRDTRDGFTCGYVEAIHSANGEHPAERREIEPDAVEGAGLFTAPRLMTFTHRQDLDHAGLIGRAISASYVAREGPAFEELRERLTELFEQRHNSRGLVSLVYLTKVYLANRL